MGQYKIYIIAGLSALVVLIIILLILNNRKSGLNKTVDALNVRFNAIKSAPIAFKLSKAQAMAKRNEETSGQVAEYYKKYDDAQSHINQIQDLFINLEDQIALRDFKEAKETISRIDGEIASSEKEIEDIDQFLNQFQKEETNQREYSQRLKEAFRDLKMYINENMQSFSFSNDGIEEKITKCEELFSLSEEAMYLNDYNKAKTNLDKIEKEIGIIKQTLTELPELIQNARGVLPVLIDQVSKEASLTRQKNINIKHLDVDAKLDEIKEKLDNDLKTLSIAETKDVKDHTTKSKETLERILKDLETENAAFEEDNNLVNSIKDCVEEIKHLNTYVSGTYKQSKERFGLEDIKPYLDEVSKKIKTFFKDYQTMSLDLSEGKAAPSELLLKLSELNNECEVERKSLLSYKMKIDQTSSDEQRAIQQLQKLQVVVNEVETKVKEYRLPTIADSYYNDLKIAKKYISDLKSLLKAIPIDADKLNEVLDAAIDYIYTFYNNVNNVVGMAIMVENAIVFGNKYRSTYPEVDRELSKAEFSYINGEYTKALTIAITCMETLFPNVTDEKILENK